MDPISQGLVGATAAQSGADKEKLRPAAFAGAVSAMIADLDYYIHIPSDPLFNIEIHRQFSHSLIFIPCWCTDRFDSDVVVFKKASQF
jgi:inner membrane protein